MNCCSDDAASITASIMRVLVGAGGSARSFIVTAIMRFVLRLLAAVAAGAQTLTTMTALVVAVVNQLRLQGAPDPIFEFCYRLVVEL